MTRKRTLKRQPRTDATLQANTHYPSWLVWMAFSAWGFLVLGTYLIIYAPGINLSALLAMLSPLQYVSGLSLQTIIDHIENLAIGLGFVLAAAGAGRFLLLRVLAPGPLNVWEDISFSTALGLGTIAHLVTALTAAGLLYKWPIIVILFAGIGLGILSLSKAIDHHEPPDVFKPNILDLTASVLFFAALIFTLGTAFGPEVFYDALVYHLAAPNFYVLKHGFADMPYNLYSSLFLLHGMLYSAGLLLRNEIVPKLINYSAGVLGAAAVLGLGRRHLSPRAGLWAALIFYTVAQTLQASWYSGADLLLTLFSLTALAAALRHKPGERKFLLISAVLAGCGMATKATGIFPAAGIMLVLFYRERFSPRAALRSAFFWGLIAILPVLPWLAKNQIYRQNPFFPFLTSVFGVPPNAAADKLAGFMADARQMGPLELKQWLIHPWTITMGKSGSAWSFTPLFLFALPLLFLIAPACAVATPLWIYFLTVWLLWSLTSGMVRFLMPAYPAAALLIAAALDTHGHRALRKALQIAALLACALGLYFSGALFYVNGDWRVICGLISKTEYLSATRDTYICSDYPAMDYINRKLPVNSKVMILGDARSFYLKRDFIVSSAFDRTPIVEYASESITGHDLYARLRREGVTHILINSSEAMRLQLGYNIFYWDKRAAAVFDDFWSRHIKESFAWSEVQGRNKNHVAVFELVGKLPAGAKPPINLVRDVIQKNVDAAKTI